MVNFLKRSALMLTLLCVTLAAQAEVITGITIDSYSTRLGMTWVPEKTLDGDTASFWMTSKSDAAPFVTYKIAESATALGKLTIHNVPTSNYRVLDSAEIHYSADDSGTFTLLGTYSFQHAGGVDEIDLAGIEAKYVKIVPLTNFYSNTVNTIADHTQDGSATWIVGFAEAIFESPEGFADAGDDISVYDANDNAEEPVTLDGSGSEFPGGSIVAYSWAIDGSEIATGVSPTVTLAVGEHEIVLTCELSDGSFDSDSVLVTVVGTPQSFASAGDDITVTDADQSGFETVTLDGSNSAWSTATWDWYEGDTHLGSGETLDVSLSVGVHTIILQCSDSSGHNDDDDVVVTVLDGSPQPPVADAGLDKTVENRTGGTGEPVGLDASGSIDYDGTITSYVWSEGGSDIATGATATVTLAIGTHTITLTVTDDDGLTDTDTVEITVVEYTGPGGDAPWIGAWEADNLFENITSEDMDIIKTKKVLFASRSFGLNLMDGLSACANIDPMYSLSRSGGYNVLSGGYDALPVDVFDNYNFVQFLASYWPHTVRMTEFDYFIRNRYHDDIDAAMVFFHYTSASTFTTYQTVMDSLRLTYPDIKFIYVTAGCSPIEDDNNNALSQQFNQLIVGAYQGAQPVYDLNSILSTHADGTANVNGSGVPYMCPEFNINGDNVHPNSGFSEARMGKAMLVVLKEIFCNETPAPKPGDADGDDDVDIFDFLILKSNYGTATGAQWTDGDFDADGDVDIFDFLILKANYGA